MALAVLLLLLGALLAGYGLHLGLSCKRPRDLAGVLLGSVGVLLALLGCGRILSERFFQ